jgi:hypothetical protein
MPRRASTTSNTVRMAHLRKELEIVGVQQARDLPARRATEWLDALAETWQKTDLVEEKSDVIHAIYERIVIEGPRFVGLRLTPAAYRHGLALALPEAVMARPTGVRRAHAHLGFRQILIEGADEWRSAALESA